MIYCKKIDDQYSDIEIEGDNYTIVDEIATTLCAVHGEYLKNQPQDAPLFRALIREMVAEGGVLWGEEPQNSHYDHLCQAAEHFGVEAQKSKAEEEMAELVDLLQDGPESEEVLRQKRIEELADVYNVIDQLCILWNCEDEVQDMAEQKMIRTMEHIQSGYYNKGGSHDHA